MSEHPLEQWRAQESERRGKPLRRRDLAKEIGCSASRYTQIVKNGDLPSITLAGKIKELTGLSIDEQVEAAE